MRTFILSVLSLICLQSFSQRLSVGPVATYFNKRVSVGGEFIVEDEVLPKLHLGFGTQVIHTEGIGTIAPAFATVGVNVGPVLIHAEPGYLLYTKLYQTPLIKAKTEGGYYIGSGAKITFFNHLYVNAQYSLYRFTSKINGAEGTTTNYHSPTLSVGWTL